MTAMETRLREDLLELADVPAPPSLADRALADARTLRRRRAVGAGVGTLALIGIVALPFVANVSVAGWHLPFGAAETTTSPCGTATDESEQQRGVPAAEYPQFVRLTVAKLPPRDDYVLQSAVGICPPPAGVAGPKGNGPYGYAVINLGPRREQGHLTVDIYHENEPVTCATVSAPPEQVEFCRDATATAPLVLAVRDDGSRDDGLIVTAIHSGRRTVSIGAFGTPFDAEALVPVVTDPALRDLLEPG